MDTLYDAVRQVESERGSRVWCMVHHGRAHICAPAVMSLFKERDEIGQGDRLDILLHSPGGHPDLAYRAMKFFRRRFKEVNIIVPIAAKSAATMMCLAADKILMGEFAELGPIDIQIDDQVKHGAKNFSPLDEFKSLEFMREMAIEWMDLYAAVMNDQYGISLKEALCDSIPLVTALMRPMFEQIEPLEMGEHRRSLAISEEYAKRMVRLAGLPNARDIVKKLVWEYPSHTFCIDFEEAREIGLPVERLSDKLDRLLCNALLKMEGSHHGFAPKTRLPAAGTGPVRKGRLAKNSGAPSRPNGRDESSTEKRV